jgi:hypothetical protein
VKAKGVVALSIAALVIFLVVRSACSTRAHLSPFALKVVDASSGKPMGGIRVDYAVEVLVKRTFLGFIPAFEPTAGYRVAKRERSTTGNDGVVTLSEGPVSLRANEEISSEWIGVNVEMNRGPEGMAMLNAVQERCTGREPPCSEMENEFDVMVLAATTELRAHLLKPLGTGRRGVELYVIGTACDSRIRDADAEVINMCVEFNAARSGQVVVALPTTGNR